MSSARVLLNFVVFLFVLRRATPMPRVLQDLSTHGDLSRFVRLLGDDESLRRTLRDRELTILAPVDAAFAAFRGRLDEHLLLYHLLPAALELDALVARAEQRRSTACVDDRLPHVYLHVDGGVLMANDARVIASDSNHRSRTRDDLYGKLQIVHKIDRLLAPMFAPLTSSASPTAYDFLAQTARWPSVRHTFDEHYRRVITAGAVALYKDATAAQWAKIDIS